MLAGLWWQVGVSAAIAAEIGTTRDRANRCADNPVDRSVQISCSTARHRATLCMPVLALVADIIGVMGGFVVGTQLWFQRAIYVQQILNFCSPMT